MHLGTAEVLQIPSFEWTPKGCFPCPAALTVWTLISLRAKDRVNCPFYLKIGACRNGERCNRVQASGNQEEPRKALPICEDMLHAVAEVWLRYEPFGACEWDFSLCSSRLWGMIAAFYKVVPVKLQSYLDWLASTGWLVKLADTASDVKTAGT